MSALVTSELWLEKNEMGLHKWDRYLGVDDTQVLILKKPLNLQSHKSSQIFHFSKKQALFFVQRR